jgi:predicted GTPase
MKSNAETSRNMENNGIYSLFDDAIQCLKTLGSKFAVNRKRLEELDARLSESRFHLAVLGQFKRGKSTFLNALLERSCFPVPCCR